MEIKVSENFEQMLHGALDATNEILQDYELDDAQNKYYRDVWECLQNFSLMIKFGYCGQEISTNAEMMAEVKKHMREKQEREL